MHISHRFFKSGLVYLLAIAIVSGCTKVYSGTNKKLFPVPKIELQPHKYVIYKIGHPLKIDGKLNEHAWQQTDWTTSFVNITGDSSGPSHQNTRAKLLWNKQYLYVGIRLMENNIVATMTKHDAPLFFENACEIFIDPDGDTQNYLEFGINALSTTYDLLLLKPYRDGGHSISEYNIRGLKAAVSIDGTINDPEGNDVKWTVEIAFPIRALRELNIQGGQARPKAGDQWRIQFARVERKYIISGNKYIPKMDSMTHRPLPPKYTSWAPQGLIDLHYPEMWGFVQFSNITAGEGHEAFAWHRSEQIKWALRKVYYHLRQYHLNHHAYPNNLSVLKATPAKTDIPNFSPAIHSTKNTFLVSSRGFDRQTVWYINQNGKIWHNTQ